MSKQVGIVSVDLETLGKFDDAVILSVGVAFHPITKIKDVSDIVSVNIKLDVKDQIQNYNRVMEEDVKEWWQKQDSSAKSILVPHNDDIKLFYLDEHLRKFIEENNIDPWKSDWMDRRNFDICKLNYLYDRLFKGKWPRHPYNTFNCYDIFSTLMALTNNAKGNIQDDAIPGIVKHNSEDDAILDLYRYLKTLENLGAFDDPI